MSGKRKTVHCPCEPTTLWLIASSVVVKLASVTTEGCSVACDVIFAAAVVRQSRYDNLSRCISYRFGDLDLQSGREQGNGKGGDGMQLGVCGMYSAHHTKASVYYDAA